jgi:hypothetical protein
MFLFLRFCLRTANTPINNRFYYRSTVAPTGTVFPGISDKKSSTFRHDIPGSNSKQTLYTAMAFKTMSKYKSFCFNLRNVQCPRNSTYYTIHYNAPHAFLYKYITKMGPNWFKEISYRNTLQELANIWKKILKLHIWQIPSAKLQASLAALVIRKASQGDSLKG